eukprot:SAG31_NODE_5959_length_2241_cov_1.092904_1_plen_445_part_00
MPSPWLALLALALLALRLRCSAVTAVGDDSHLRYMAVYGWETQLTAGMVGWINLAKGPVTVANLSNPTPTLEQLINATLTAHRELAAPVLWSLPSGVISPGAVSLPLGWEDKLAELDLALSPLVKKGVVAGFFTGDEQCANGTCIENQLGPVAERLHALFDPDGPVVVYANEALKVCDPKRGNTSWLLPASIDLFSVDVYSSGGLAEVGAVKAAVETCVLPRLRPNQSAMLVPGIFGNSGLPLGQGGCRGLNKYGQPAYAQNETAAVLQGLFEWAQTQPRIAGFCPWHYNDRCGLATPPRNCHDAKPPCDMDRGAVSMPIVRAKLEQIGRAIVTGSWKRSQKRERAEVAVSVAVAAQPPQYPVLLPKWTVSYAMADSTIAMASNSKTFFNATLAAKFGIIAFDHNNAYALWYKHIKAGHMPKGTTSEEYLVQQCALVKRVNNRE